MQMTIINMRHYWYNLVQCTAAICVFIGIAVDNIDNIFVYSRLAVSNLNDSVHNRRCIKPPG